MKSRNESIDELDDTFVRVELDDRSEGLRLLSNDHNDYATFADSPTQASGTIIHFIKQYSPSPGTLFYASTGFITTLPFLPYCFTSSPESISAAWWLSLSTSQQVFLISNALIYLSVGTATRFKYYQIMVENLKKLLSHYCDGIGNFSYNSIILFLAAISAIPTAALGYYGSTWAGNIVASICGLSNFFNTCALRIVFIPNFITSLTNIFDEDRRYQKALITQLKRLKNETIVDFNNFLSTDFSTEEMNERLVKKLLKRLNYREHSLLTTHSTSSIFYAPSWVGYAKHKSHVLTAGGVGLFLSAAFLIFISQAGFEGFKLICYSLTDNCQIDSIPYWLKLGIAITPGITAGIVAFMSGFELIKKVLKFVINHLLENPWGIIKLLLIMACCALTAVSLMNAAKSLASKPNLFGLSVNSESIWDNLYLYLYLIGNYGIAMSLDMSACVQLVGLTKPAHSSPTVNGVTHWLHTNPLSHDAVLSLRRHGVFAQKRVPLNDSALLTSLKASMD